MPALRDRLDGSLDRPFWRGIARRRRCPKVAPKRAAFAPAEGVTYRRLYHAVNESEVVLIELSNQLNGPYVDDGQRRRQRLPKRASWVTGQWILPSKGSTLGVKVFK
jgi:hypothetical protein